MVWMEDNICIYRYGEILHTSAVLVGTIHVIQGIYINWREPAFSSVVCKQKVCLTTKRRMAKEMQVVGGPNSTDEGMNKINTRGKSRENCSSQFWPEALGSDPIKNKVLNRSGSDGSVLLFPLFQSLPGHHRKSGLQDIYK